MQDSLTRTGFLRVMENLENCNFIFQAWKTLEFEKNAKTHGKLMEKIFVNKKNVVMLIFIEFV